MGTAGRTRGRQATAGRTYSLLSRLVAEGIRLSWMRSLEEELASLGLGAVAGVDEAGRGCLAGPVVAAAVIPGLGPPLPGVDDSKALEPASRERLAAAIRSTARAVSVAESSPAVIDRVNILEATRQAMSRAVAALRPPADCAIVDAVALDGLSIPCIALVRADQISYAVACASIVAKVERDRRMEELDREYPHYGFARHKGYGAPAHREALGRFGPSPVHRLTFRSVVPRTEH